MVIRLHYKLISFLCAVLVVGIGIGLEVLFFSPSREAQAGEPQIQAGKQVPIVMYHHMLKDKSRWGDYVVSPEEFESDVRYLKENGFTTVVIQDLIDYVGGKKELPKKPVIITFDDGYESTFVYALPILKKYQAKAVVSVIGSCSDLYSGHIAKNLSYSNMTWNQVAEIQKSGLVEVQNHSYDMHESKGDRRGARMVKGETQEKYRQAMQEDLMLNQERIQAATGVLPTCFTYPFGYVDKNSSAIIKDLGFQASLSCASGISRVQKGNPDSLFLLKRYNRPHGGSSETFFQKALKQLVPEEA